MKAVTWKRYILLACENVCGLIVEIWIYLDT